MKRRSSGILLHITSLPGPFGIGDLGPGAYRWADFLARSGQSCWQLLPVNPPTPAARNSPYTALSAFAGNTMLISPELMLQQGLLSGRDIAGADFDGTKVDYPAVGKFKNELFDIAFDRFKAGNDFAAYESFCRDHAYWLEDFALFVALYEHFGSDTMWCHWPRAVRDRRADALEKMRKKLAKRLDREKFLQYLFYQQWFALKRYCDEKGIKLIGDIPIYVSYESADVWSHPGIFKLTAAKRMKAVAGVPPDLFSETGQLWGNPLFDWDALKKDDYSWWIKRLKHNLSLFDITRIDHFRGLIGYWQVPGKAKTAVNGKWMPGPGRDFFHIVFRHFPHPPIIVEDLGYITADVREAILKYDLACMKVLLFSFEGDPAHNPYCLHNHIENSVVYTGTHDNNTARGWFDEASGQQKQLLFDYIGRKIDASQVAWELIRLAQMSVSRLAVVPMQDVLNLAGNCRMNYPSRPDGNWQWRMTADQMDSPLSERLAQLTKRYGRS